MNTDRANAFCDKRVLITGHTGFKGSWLTIWLHKLGARVTGYSLPPPTVPSLFEVARVRELLERHVEADVRAGLRLERVLCDTKPDFVFHLAAQPIVGAGYQNPRETFDINVMGTVSLLEAVRCHGVRECSVVIVTSDKCYEAPSFTEDANPLGFRESDRLGGADPYSASKGAAELVVRTYLNSYFDPLDNKRHPASLASARAGNVIGGGDWSPRRIVPDLVRAIAGRTPVVVRMPGAIRPWQHVLEPLCGYLRLATRPKFGTTIDDSHSPHRGAWNFGPPPESCVDVRTLVARFHAAFGRGSSDESSGFNDGEIRALNICSDKARAILGWRARWSLDETIRRTAHWYRRYYEAPGADMRQACLDDIAAYEAAEPLP